MAKFLIAVLAFIAVATADPLFYSSYLPAPYQAYRSPAAIISEAGTDPALFVGSYAAAANVAPLTAELLSAYTAGVAPGAVVSRAYGAYGTYPYTYNYPAAFPAVPPAEFLWKR